MECTKCKYEFCWYCLGPFARYVHQVPLACPVRYFATVGVMILLIVFLNMKVAYSCDLLMRAEYFVAYHFLAFVLINIYAFSFAAYFLVYDGYTRYRLYEWHYDNNGQRSSVLLLWVCLLVVLLSMHGLFLQSLPSYEFSRHMLVIGKYEVVFAGSGSTFYGVFWLLSKAYVYSLMCAQKWL